MSEIESKLSYNSMTKEVRFSMPASLCFEHDKPPNLFLDKAEAKLKKEMADGHIERYFLFTDRFNKTWQAIREQVEPAKAKEMLIELTIGGGVKGTKGIILEKSIDPQIAYTITFSSSSHEVELLSWEIIKTFLHLETTKMGLPDLGNMSQVMGAWIRKKQGENITKLPIFSTVQHSEPNAATKPYTFSANKKRSEVAATIYSKDVLSTKEQVNALYKAILAAHSKVNETMGGACTLLKNELGEALRMLAFGPERFGVDLPCSLLIGIGGGNVISVEEGYVANPNITRASPAAAGKPSDAGKSKNDGKAVEKRAPGYGLLMVEALDKGMKMVVKGFDMQLYKKVTLNQEWLENEYRRLKINLEDQQAAISQLLDALALEKDLNGMVVATGIGAEPASEPFLYEVFKDYEMTTETKKVSLKDRQVADIVRKGQLVAEIRFANEGLPGRDVFGAPIDPIKDYKSIEIKCLEGVREGKGGKFFATVQGMIIVDNNTISVMQSYLHKGDVNLKSGNIVFNGAATVEGSIDHGAVVMVAGDLTVTGAIGAAFVQVGGNLIVNGGIVTGERGMLRVKGNVEAEFIGNANIICTGNIKAKQSILNSRLVAGGGIEIVMAEGRLAGGEINSRESIVVGRLGFPNGDVTTVTVGADWVIQNSLRIKTSRLAKVERISEEDRKVMREMVRKKANQLTKAHRIQIERLKERSTQSHTIIDKLKQQIFDKQRQMNWKKESNILVRHILSTNVNICIGGKKIPVTHEVVEVAITAEKRRGSHINPAKDVAKDAG